MVPASAGDSWEDPVEYSLSCPHSSIALYSINQSINPHALLWVFNLTVQYGRVTIGPFMKVVGSNISFSFTNAGWNKYTNALSFYSNLLIKSKFNYN